MAPTEFTTLKHEGALWKTGKLKLQAACYQLHMPAKASVAFLKPEIFKFVSRSYQKGSKNI